MSRLYVLVALVLGVAQGQCEEAKVQTIAVHEKGGRVVTFDRWVAEPPAAVVAFMDAVHKAEMTHLLYQTSYGGHCTLFSASDSPPKLTKLELVTEIGPCLAYKLDFESSTRLIGKQPHEALLVRLVGVLYGSEEVVVLKRTANEMSVTLHLQLHGPKWDRKPEKDAPAAPVNEK
jgi:hypothetical protein